MTRKIKDENSTILRNVFVLMPSFYLIYYLVSIIMVGSFGLLWEELGLIPFDFNNFGFEDGKPLGNNDQFTNR